MLNIAQENFALWNQALQTRDPKKVAELYEDENTFLPTLSADFKKGLQGAEEYFHHFLEKNPFGTVVEEEVQEINNNAYIHSGLYNFDVGPENNRTVAEARFTFVWRRKIGGKWKIAHHHSSLKPEAN